MKLNWVTLMSYNEVCGCTQIPKSHSMLFHLNGVYCKTNKLLSIQIISCVIILSK